MTRKPLPTSRGGVAGVALLLCATAGGVGFAFDLFNASGASIWFFTDPGGRAALGAGAVTAVVLIAHAARWLLARGPGDKGGRDAGDHA